MDEAPRARTDGNGPLPEGPGEPEDPDTPEAPEAAETSETSETSEAPESGTGGDAEPGADGLAPADDSALFSPGFTSPGFSSPDFDTPEPPAGPQIGESEMLRRMRAEQQGEDAVTPRPLPEEHRPPQPPRPGS